jgi:hypothetical protein
MNGVNHEDTPHILEGLKFKVNMMVSTSHSFECIHARWS